MKPFEFSTGDNARKDNESWNKKVLEENNKKEADKEKARQAKFDDIKLGDTAMYRGEIYLVKEKLSDNLTINIESKNEENKVFSYGLTVSVDEIADYYTPNKNL